VISSVRGLLFEFLGIQRLLHRITVQEPSLVLEVDPDGILTED